LSFQDVLTLEDHRNSLLNRRELKVLFRGAAGKIKRIDAAEKIAGELKVEAKKVVPINLVCRTGMTDLHALFYVYDDEKDIETQLPRYRKLRTLPKAERKKILDEEKATKLKAKQEAAAAAKGGRPGGKK
jgi:small subunit ribosomal protein S24e